MHFGSRFGDDIMGSPACTSSGDLMCWDCMVRYERETEEREAEEAGYYDPSDFESYEEMMGDAR